MQETTKRTIKDYILTEFLPGENPDELTHDTELITGGILDSLATLKLVAFLEEEFNIEVAPHETGVDYLNSIDLISQFVDSKKDQ